jgi:hypothetical protein
MSFTDAPFSFPFRNLLKLVAKSNSSITLVGMNFFVVKKRGGLVYRLDVAESKKTTSMFCLLQYKFLTL